MKNSLKEKVKKLSKERGEETQSDQLDDVGAAINELVKASSIRTKEHLRLCGTNHSDGGFDIYKKYCP